MIPEAARSVNHRTTSDLRLVFLPPTAQARKCFVTTGAYSRAGAALTGGLAPRAAIPVMGYDAKKPNISCIMRDDIGWM